MSEAHSLRITLPGPGGTGDPTGRGTSAGGGRAGATAVVVVEGLSYEGSACVCTAGTLAAGRR